MFSAFKELSAVIDMLICLISLCYNICMLETAHCAPKYIQSLLVKLKRNKTARRRRNFVHIGAQPESG
jgi:hypothetical protein